MKITRVPVYSIGRNSFGQTTISGDEKIVYTGTEAELIEWLKANEKKGAPLLIKVEDSSALKALFNFQDWDDEKFVSAWSATCFSKGIVTGADEWEEAKAYFPHDEFLDQWFFGQEESVIEEYRQHGFSAEEIEDLSRGWSVPVEDLMRQVYEL